jgi:hypothetical protein
LWALEVWDRLGQNKSLELAKGSAAISLEKPTENKNNKLDDAIL